MKIKNANQIKYIDEFNYLSKIIAQKDFELKTLFNRRLKISKKIKYAR